MKKKFDYLSYVRKYEIVIASAAVLVLVIILVFNMLLPNLNRANEIYAQGQTLKKKLEVLKQKDGLLSSLDYQYYKDIYLKSNFVLPEDKNYVTLIGTFDLLEKESAVTITRTDFQLGVVSTSSANLTRAVGTPAYVIPVTLEVTGTFAGLQRFLEAVANVVGRLMVFDDVSVVYKPGGVLSASFTGRAFFYPLPTTLGSIDSPLPRPDKNQEAIMKKIAELNLPQDTGSVELDKAKVGKNNLFQ